MLVQRIDGGGQRLKEAIGYGSEDEDVLPAPVDTAKATKTFSRTRRECGASGMDLRSQFFFESDLRLGRGPRRPSSRQRMPPKERRETGRHPRASLDVQQVANALDGKRE